MTLKYINGFETSRDDSDFRSQGWYLAGGAKYVGFTPSFTGLAGTSMQLLSAPGPGNANIIGNSSAADVGYYNTGVTVNQAWLAGGFTMGIAGRFNKGTPLIYGPGTVAGGAVAWNTCYDDVNKLYWAVQYNGSAYALANSSDLINWTVVATPVLPTNFSGVSYMGAGVVAFAIATAQTATQIYWTNNSGNTWNLQALGTASAAAAQNMVGHPTGNSTFPHIVYMQTLSSGNQRVYVGTLGGTMTQVASTNVANSTSVANFSVCQNVAIICDGNTASFNNAYSADLTSSSLNTAGVWNAMTWSTYPGAVYGTAYNPVSNTYVLVSSAGIYTFPNSGAVGTAVPPTGAQTLTQRLSGAAMYKVFWNAAIQKIVVFGASGNIYTSPDGFTWTSQGQHINPVATGNGNLFNAVYTGTQYALFDATNGVISTTPDGVSNYQAMYIRDPAETTIGYYGAMGVFSAANFTTNTFTLVTNVGMVPATASGGARVVSLYESSTVVGTSSVSTTPLNHYYELIATAVPGTANAFTVTMNIDGQVAVTSAVAFQMGSSTSDTTSVLGLVLGRGGQIVAWDDLYFCLNDGTGISGVQGPINIVARRPTTDVQANWTKNGSAASNSLTVNQPALSSQSSNFISSTTNGDKDLYTSSTAIPSGYRPLAVQLEAYTYKVSTTIPSINIGLKSGSTESDSPTLSVTSTSPTFLSQVYQNDPNGNVAWTSTSVQNAEFVVNHVS